MAYVDAFWARDKDQIFFSERVQGKRRIREEPAVFECYFEDPNGTHTSTYGTRCSPFRARTYKEFVREVKTRKDAGAKIFESDHDVLFKSIGRYYPGEEQPDLHISFLDIETKFIKGKGFAPASDPFAPITAITVYNSWQDTCYTFVTPPDGMSFVTAEKLVQGIENVFICTEEEILNNFLAVIEDADLLSGWNSGGFDIPYIIGRLVHLFGEYKTAELCLFGQKPKRKEITHYGKKTYEYELVGRLHLDYLLLYKKHAYKVQESYKLDHIGEVEVQEQKVHYEGTLDELYCRDFRKFVMYSIQDVLLLVKIDKKKKFIDLANSIAHKNHVTIPKTMGSVAWLDQAMINYSHDCGLVVPDKIDREQEGGAAGAFVIEPKVGLRKWVGSVDVNSLYPSIIRSLNMDPSTVVGQIRSDYTDQYLLDYIEEHKLTHKDGTIDWAEAWGPLFGVFEYEWVRDKSPEQMVTVDFEEQGQKTETVTFTAAELHEMIYRPDSGLFLSANGTIFRTDRPGIIAERLTSWYAERAATKKLAGELYGLYGGKTVAVDCIDFVPDLSDAPKSIQTLISEKSDRLLKLADECGLCIRNGQLISNNRDLTKKQAEYYDKLQNILKITLNSCYGALLNSGSKFYDKRIGQSVTLSGKNVVRHMMSKITEIGTGEYTHNHPMVVAGDTDSVSGSSIVITRDGYLPISEYFELGVLQENVHGCELSILLPEVLSYDPETKSAKFMSVQHCYRRKVSKGRYLVTDDLDNRVEVTEDHSVIVLRNGQLIDVKPAEILTDDIGLSLGTLHDMVMCGIRATRIYDYENEYVYDIGMADQTKPWFFANDILVHNSCYFSLYEAIQANPESELAIAMESFEWTRDNVTALYDDIAHEMNNSFPSFMTKAFNCHGKYSSIIKAGRENIAEYSLFVAKKRYAMMVYDAEGEREDKDGKPGKLKIMGLEMKRSDTPKEIADFLTSAVSLVLQGKDVEQVRSFIKEYRSKFKDMPAYLKGTPKAIKNLSKYEFLKSQAKSGQKVNMPGHATASFNWNALRTLNGDNYSDIIEDGTRIVVCKLRANAFGYTSIAYPVDQSDSLPDWFKSLPFDEKGMEEGVLEKKIENIFGCLGWSLGGESASTQQVLSTFFEF